MVGGREMTPDEFWAKVDLILAGTRNRPDAHSPMTQSELFAACGDFLVEIDLLAEDWYTNRMEEPMDK